MSRKRATAKSSSTALHQILADTSTPHIQACIPPLRSHTLAYHSPQLLRGSGPEKLLHWFDGISQARAMPWRKPWTDGSTSSSNAAEGQTSIEALTTRAYEVLVSEIMLQQTRVATVIPYFTSWIEAWPTVHDLAAASPDAVLAAWKGLGYYSRATRLHEAAQQVVNDLGGCIPADVDGLLRITGVGPYTAGAVSSIAFGRAVPLLDGNVARVLARQLGLYARVKDKKIEDVLWYAAKILVEGVSHHSSPEDASSAPGRWNQALMELGSTICTPKPKCEACPIQESCRAYAEGIELKGQAKNEKLDSAASHTTVKKDEAQAPNLVDIEDVCILCLPIDPEDIPSAIPEGVQQDSRGRKRSAAENGLPLRPGKATKITSSKQTTLGAFVTRSKTNTATSISTTAEADSTSETDLAPISTATECKPDPSLAQVTGYCSLFPAREIKKTIPTQDSLVCIIKQTCTGKRKRNEKPDAEPQEYILLEQRPSKGLLANLWRFPTMPLTQAIDSEISTDTHDKTSSHSETAASFIKAFLDKPSTLDTADQSTHTKGQKRKKSNELGSILHVFSHLKVRMHVFAFNVESNAPLDGDAMDIAATGTALRRMWVPFAAVDGATLDAGSVRCWALYGESKG